MKRREFLVSSALGSVAAAASLDVLTSGLSNARAEMQAPASTRKILIAGLDPADQRKVLRENALTLLGGR